MIFVYIHITYRHTSYDYICMQLLKIPQSQVLQKILTFLGRPKIPIEQHQPK